MVTLAGPGRCQIPGRRAVRQARLPLPAGMTAWRSRVDELRCQAAPGLAARRARPGVDCRAAAPAAATSHSVRPPRPHGTGLFGGQAGPGGIHHGRKESTMKVFKAVFAALPLLASLLLLPAARASTLSSGSGSFTTTGEVISIRHADGNTIVIATEVQTL